jgi:hypothetical protein
LRSSSRAPSTRSTFSGVLQQLTPLRFGADLIADQIGARQPGDLPQRPLPRGRHQLDLQDLAGFSVARPSVGGG